MWKRILTLVTFLLALAVTLSVLGNLITEAKAMETEEIAENAVIQLAFEKAEVAEAIPAETAVAVTIPEETETAETIPMETVVEETIAVEIEQEAEDDGIIEFEGRQYNITSIPWNREPGVTESGYVERITEVPHYIQHYYRDARYGNHGSVASHGCGITCLAMVYTYLLDQEVMPDYLGEKFGRYNTPVGSDWGVFTATGEYFDIDVEKTHKWHEALEALENGHLVIAQANPDSIFTDGGHFILLYGLTEEGKIMVKDPSIYNYSVESSYLLKEGFENGFNHENVKFNCCPFWIFQHKDLEEIAARAEAEELNSAESMPN